MTSMEFECENCGQPLSADNDMRGMTLPCPACREKVTVPGKPFRPRAATTASENYFIQHWRGQLTLGASYWVNGFLVSILLGFIGKALASENDAISMQLGTALSLTFVAIALVVTVWQFVGIWRSANNYGASIRALLAKLGVVIGVLNCGYFICHSLIPQCEMALSVIEGDYQLPPYRVWAVPGGTEVVFRGGIRAGCADRLAQVLSAHPQASVLDIESPGGRILEARKMIDLVRQHRLITYTSEECASAATLVFISGRQRIVDGRARVGFHAGSLPGATIGQQNNMDDLVRSTMQSQGVSGAFIDRVLATPPSQLWFPTFKQMLDAGVATSQTFGDPFAPYFPPKGSAVWKGRNKVAQARVVAAYPDIGVANTPINAEFVAEYQYQKDTDPAFLDNPEYPLAIIEILQTTHPDFPSPNPARPSSP